MGELGAASILVAELAIEASKRVAEPHAEGAKLTRFDLPAESTKKKDNGLQPRELAQVMWAVAALGGRPARPELFLGPAHAACDAFDPTQALNAHDVVRVAAALGAWAVRSDSPDLPAIWAALRFHAGCFTPDELLMAACATVRVGIRDDALMQKLSQRAQMVGPFDPQGAMELGQSFTEYWRAWGCESSREATLAFAVAAARRGGTTFEFVSQCLAPPPLPDVRSEQLREALRDQLMVDQKC